jgi:phenylacetate-coenzyme A ligase PaaK-like adenylate-forming protein
MISHSLAPSRSSRRSVRAALFFPYARLRGHQLARYRDEYERETRSERAAAIRERRLRQLLDHARREVEYYRDLGVTPQADVLDELSRYPILTKAIIRANGGRLKSNDVDARHPYTNTSGGSTGEPIQLTQDREFADRSATITSLLYERMGYFFGETQYRLWGSEQEILHGLRPSARFWRRVYNATILNAFRMTPATMREHLALIDRHPPRLLVCYAQAIYELACYARDHGIAVSAPHAITCSAGTLYPFMREAIEQVFRCPVYNWYGSREVGVIATQLPQETRLVVPPAAHVVEIVDDAGRPVPAGTEGDVLVTCLLNHAMPLIRYRIGDRAALAPSAADGVQRLTHLSGRNVDTFRTREGTLVDGEYFTHLLYFRPWVRKFQFVQTHFDRVELRIRPAETVAAAEAAAAFQSALPEIVGQIRAVLGAACAVDARLVEEIPPSRSGKHRYTICAIDGASAA